jgi:hypothetical protein
MKDKEHHMKCILEAIIAEADRVNDSLENLQAKTRSPDASTLINSSLESLQIVYKLIKEEEIHKVKSNPTVGNINNGQLIAQLNELSLLATQIQNEIANGNGR